jgi:acetyltransferase-like isoleucine patch superfamily enzyme
MSGQKGSCQMFILYSYLNGLYNFVLNISPPPIRTLIFRVTLGNLGRKVLIDYACYFRYPSKIKIGNRVSINRGCQFYPSYRFKDAFIVLEDDVILGPNVTFLGAGQNPRLDGLDDIGGTIRVGEGAYIGANSIIRYGVSIGSHSIIGAGSVVVRDVAPRAIVGGSPARLIRER